MAKYSNQVVYDIKANIDASGIKQLQSELSKLKQVMSKDIGQNNWGLTNKELTKSIQQVEQLQKIFNKGFDATTGTYNIKKINTLLNTTNKDIQGCTVGWTQFGIQGQRALTSVATTLTQIQKQSVSLNSLFGKLGTTMANTVRWGITASIFQEMLSSVQSAVSYMKDLDESLTNIQMVTNSSKEDMRELAQYANNAAQALGSTTTDYTNAVKVFVQEGFSESESKQYANLSTKLANVSEQNTATTSDQITAYRNAFQLDYEQTVAAMDKVANVANNTASNVNELMTASQRAASVAQAVGSSQDSFLAAIATIESVTRQSAEEIGNGLKTIYQRFADIKVSGSTDDGVDYGQYANALKSVGVDVLDVAGQFKGMDQILAELQDVWSELDDTMKIAVGEKVAGKFQYNRFAALMNNPEYYQKALSATQNADGMMDQMNEYYMEGIEGRLKTLQAAGEQIISTLFNQDDIEPVLDNVTNILNNINSIVDALGGVRGVLAVLAPLMWKTFGSQISSGITSIASNIVNLLNGTSRLKETLANLGLNTLAGQESNRTITALQKIVGFENKISTESYKEALLYVQQIGEAELKIQDILEKTKTRLQENVSVIIEEKDAIQEKINAQRQDNEITKQQLANDMKRLSQLNKIKQQGSSGTFRDTNGRFVSLNLINEEIEKIKERNELNKQELETSSQVIQRSKERITELEKAREYTKEIQQLVKNEKIDYEQLEQKVGLYVESLQKAGMSTRQMEPLLQRLNEELRAMGVSSDLLKTKLATMKPEALINGIGKVVSGLTSALMSLQMFKEAGEQFEKGDYFGGTLSVLMGISMVLPLLTSAMKILKLETIAETAAQWGLNAAMAANPIGLVVAAIAALIAIIGGIVTLYTDWQNRIHASNIEFEAQKKLLNEVKDSYNEIVESVDSLKNSIDSIADKKKNLEDLKEGTLEWKKAVVDLNQEIVNLLEIYPELAKSVKNENGVLGFGENELDQFYEKQLDMVRSAQNIVTIQQARTYSANSNSVIEDFANQHSNSSYTVSKEAVGNFVNQINEGALGIEEACKKLGLDVNKNGDELIALAETVKSNNTATDALNATLEETTDYKSFASTPDGEEAYQAAYNSLEEKYGSALNGWDELIVSWFDGRFNIADQTDFKDLAKYANNLKGNVTSISEAMDNYDWIIKTDADEEIRITKKALHEKMALYQAEQDIEQKKLEENKKIYENLGVEWDSTTNKPKGELSADNQAALDAFQNNESFQKTIKEYSDTYNIPLDTAEQFSAALRDGAINVDGLAEAIKKLTPEVVDLTHNINGNEFTNRVDISSNEDDLKKILEDAEISEGAFGRMARDSYEDSGGYYQQEKTRLKELIEAKKEDGIVTENESEEIKKLNSEIEGLNESSRDTTAMIVNMSDGVVDLRKKISDISEILSNEALKGSVEWYEALTDLDEGLSQVLNIDAGTLSDAFLESGDALAYAQRMAEGDMSAIDDLRRAASQDIVQNLNIQVTGDESVDELRAGLMAELNQLQADIDAGAITITTDLDTHPFVNKLNEMLATSQISAEQATQILSSMGMEANIKHAKGKGTVQAIEYQPTLAMDAMNVDLGPLGTFKVPGIKMTPVMRNIDTEIDIPYLEGTHYTGSGVQTAGVAASNPNYTGTYNGNPKSSTPSNSSSKTPSQSKNNQEKDKENTGWDYLTDITNDLDRASAAMEKMTKLEDRLFGKNRVSQLKKLQSEYKNYIKLLQQEVKLAEQHAERLRTNAYDENGNLTINGYANYAGFNQINFDSTGNLENGKAIEAALIQRVNDAIAAYNIHRNDDDTGYYEKQIQIEQEAHDGFMKALSDYESTLGTIEEGQSAIQDYKEKIQDAADAVVDAIQEGLENVLKAMDSQRDFNRMYRDWQQGGSSYSHFNNSRRYYEEGLQSLLSPSSSLNNNSVFDMQLQNLDNRIKDAEDVFDTRGKDNKSADDEKLSQQAAFENLQEATENILDSLQKMVDYYDSLLSTIQEASDKMDELIDDRLQEFDSITDYLDTRFDQMQLLFGDKSYEQQSQIYEQKIATNMEKMVSINTAIEAKQVTVAALEKLEAKGKELSIEERKELQDARDKIRELQKEQLNTETQILQDIQNQKRAVVTSEMNKMLKDLFGGADIDWLSQQWELATRNSEKYLDDYNRAFEIQKLQLKFQETLNDNQNQSLAAQRKINALADEYLTYLREKENLSEYDVKHAQMQLDILQKQIALEDARNNKSQMRLQRNAAGNYDFVYAADEEAINQATEALLQAQQDSYNLSKQIYLDTYEAAYQAAIKTRDMVVEIATDASLSTEQQAERIHYVLENLNEYMQGSSIELGEIGINLYNSFVEASQAIAEINQGALSGVFDQMQQQALAVQKTMASVVNGVNDQFTILGENATNQIANIHGNIYEVISAITNDVTGEEGALNSIQGGIGTFEEGLIGPDGTLNKIRVGTKEHMDQINPEIISPVLSTIDERFNLTQTNIVTNVSDIETAIQTASIKLTGTTTKNLSEIDTNVKATLIKIFGSIQDTNSNIEVILNGTVTRIKENGEKVKSVYNDIDENLKKKFDNIQGPNGYLQQFESKTRETLKIAKDNYDNFTRNAVQYAGDELDKVRQKTNEWRGDLNTLRTTIEKTADQMDYWKDKINNAMNKAKDFITKSNDIQTNLGGIGIMAGFGSGGLDNFSDSAYNAGSAIQTMASQIANGYESLRQAVDTAAAAYDNLKWYADNAKAAMDDAAWAARNAQDTLNTLSKDAPPGYEWDIEGTVQNIKNQLLGMFHQPVDPYEGNIYYYGGGAWGAMYDTGGYTGSWFDKGIDNKNGKLAILHQKELVLNAHDTENMLSAVEVVRDIMSGINSLPSLGKTLMQQSFGDNIEQRVEINATFPGVTEAIEIKQALEQLADNAYQVANRYKY